MPSEQEFHALKRHVEEMEAREREADLELRAKLLAIVNSIEKKHKIGKYSQPAAISIPSEVTYASQNP